MIPGRQGLKKAWIPHSDFGVHDGEMLTVRSANMRMNDCWLQKQDRSD